MFRKPGGGNLIGSGNQLYMRTDCRLPCDRSRRNAPERPRTVRLGVSLASCGAKIPPTGNNDQDQVAKEHPDQPADENRPIVRFRGLPANPTDKPSDEGAESGSRHRIDARGKEEEYSLVNC